MRIAFAEWRWALIASLLVMGLSSVPIIAGYLGQTPDQIFGGAVFDRMDYNVHLASIQTGRRGSRQYPLLHSSEIIPPAYVKLFYIAVGQAGRILPLPAPVLFEMARWLCGVGALLTMYAFAARFLRPVALRRTAFLLFAFGSGLGWLLLILNWQPAPDISPIDFWLIDLYGFFSLLTFPHFAAVFALLWTTALAFLNHWQTRRWRWLIIGITAAVLMQAIQPFAPLMVDVALGLYVLWLWRSSTRFFETLGLGLLAIAQLPLLIYSSIVFSHPIWQSFARQNLTLSPPPLYYVLGLGVLGALAVGGAWQLVRRGLAGEKRLLLTWVIGVTVLIYLPTAFQRRFTEGAIGPIAVLAATGMGSLLPQLRRLKSWLVRVGYPYRRARGLALILIIATTLPSSMYLAFGGALLGLTRSPKLFELATVTEAIDWLGGHSAWQDTVFSAEPTGAFIPARIGHRVYLGHMFETVEYQAKMTMVEKFFGSAMSDDARRAVLASCRCRFVFYGPSEKAVGNFNPPAFLRLVFTNTTVAIYEFSP